MSISQLSKEHLNKKITIGIATRGNDIYYKLLSFVLDLNSSEWNSELLLKESPYSASEGQEKIFSYVCEKDRDYLLMIDSDICPPDNCLARMLSHNKDIVMAPIWFWDDKNKELHLNISRTGGLSLEDRVYKKGFGLERILSASFGLMLVKVSALKEFISVKESFTQWSPFIDHSYTKGYSDNIFFAKARKLGIEAYVDWGIENVVHYRTIALCDEMIKKVLNNVNKPA